jgi:hypothetical protein
MQHAFFKISKGICAILQKTFAKYEWLFLKYIQLRSCG